MKIDALCVPGHKGLYAPQGCAMIIFRTSDQNDETNSFNHAFTNKNRVGDTVIEGGNGINSRDIYMPDFYPERYEAGTLAVPNIVGLLEGINWIKKTGIQNIHEHEKNLALEMINSLKNMDNIKLYLAGEQSGTFMFNIEGKDSETTAKLLNNARICVRSGFHCSPLAHDMLGTGDSGAVRISFGSFNKYSDVVYSMNTIKNICRS